MHSATLWWTTPDGIRLHGRDFRPAGGPARLPVVCLHGLTRNSRDFESVAPWIAAQGRRALVLDMRGRGGSEPDPQPERYNPATYAQDVLGFLAAEGVARAIFVGTSMGGLVTLVLSMLSPATPAAVVFNDVGPDVSPAGLERIKAYVGKPVVFASWAEAADYARTVAAIAAPPGDPVFETIARRLFREAAPGRIVPDYDMAIAAGLNRSGDEGATPSVWPAYEQLAKTCPILVVRGADSDILAPETVARMAALAADFAVQEVAGVGHAPTLDEPAARAGLKAFLARLP